jgi:hypothetical protein
LEERSLLSVISPTTFKDGNAAGAGSLRAAVIAANADPSQEAVTIQLKAGTYTLSLRNPDSEHETESLRGDLNVTNTAHQLIIEGQIKKGAPATIIRQTVADRVFQIVEPGVQLVFKNLVIERGHVVKDAEDALGGGILNNGGNVTLDNVIVRSNKASAQGESAAHGGGVYSTGGTLTLNTVVFSQNTASGGLLGVGGGVYALETGITASQATFSKNTARGREAGSGGAIFFDNSLEGSTLNLTNAALSGNRALGRNGPNGRAAVPTGTSISAATGSTSFDGADGGAGLGGGIYVSSGVATLSSVTFSGNVAQGGKGGNGANALARVGGSGGNAGSGGAGQGGGMYISIGAAALSDVVLSKNIARGGAGGHGGNAAKGHRTPSGSGGSGGAGGAGGNGGDGQGGGIYVDGSVTLAAVNFSSNTAQAGNGGGGGKGVKVRSRTTSGVITNGGTGGAGGNGGNGQGGGMFIAGGEVTLDFGQLAQNIAKRGLAGKRGAGTPPEVTGAHGKAEGHGIAVLEGIFASTNTTFPPGQEPVDVSTGSATTSGVGASGNNGLGGGLYAAGGEVSLDFGSVAIRRAHARRPRDRG